MSKISDLFKKDYGDKKKKVIHEFNIAIPVSSNEIADAVMKLRPSEVTMAKKLGVSEEEYARAKLRTKYHKSPEEKLLDKIEEMPWTNEEQDIVDSIILQIKEWE